LDAQKYSVFPLEIQRLTDLFFDPIRIIDTEIGLLNYWISGKTYKNGYGGRWNAKKRLFT
jgi:hypothetical protein